MSFWKKLFGKKNTVKKGKSYLEKCKTELDELGLRSEKDLESLMKSLITSATKIEVQKPSRPPENSQLKSHFGGQPYFEIGEQWPETKKKDSLNFIFQVFNAEEIQLPDSIALVQFYYNWDAFPWDTNDDGWLVKIYKKIEPEKMILIEKPADLERSKYCEIQFKPYNTLPNWEGIDGIEPNASKLSRVLNDDEPWEMYEKVVQKLVGESTYQSQLAGYPSWIQGNTNPEDRNGNDMKLLFQIDSEENADIMWGDSGCIYVFYEEETQRIEFMLQCF